MLHNKSTISICVVICMLLLLSIATDAYAQQTTGTVTGRVIEQGTGNTLPGANVIITGTAQGAAVDRDGNFRIRRVSSGTYIIRASFMGYESQEEEITVQAGESVHVNFELRSDVIETAEVVVSAILRGQTRAMQQQMTALSPRTVVSAELMEEFGDYDLVSSLGRIPGVHLGWDDGDPHSFRVGGQSYGKQIVTMDGIPLPANHGGHRGTRLSGFGADMIESLELVDGATPDMDASSLTGSVNINTTPVTGRVPDVRLRMGGDYSANPAYPVTFVPRVSGRYRQQVSDRVGVQLQGEYRRTTRHITRLDLDWDVEEINGQETWILDRIRPGDETIRTDRWSVSGYIDYRLTEDTWFYGRALLSEQGLADKFRQRARSELGRGDYLSMNEVVNGYRVDRDYTRDHRDRGVNSVTFGGETLLFDGGLALDFALNYSYGHSTRLWRYDWDFRYNNAESATFDVEDWRKPSFAPSADVLEPSNYVLRSFTNDQAIMQDHNYIANLNMETPIDIGFLNGSLKFGGRYHFRNNELENFRYRYGWDGDGNLTMEPFAVTDNFKDPWNPSWTYGFNLDEDAFHDFFWTRQNDFEFEEDTYWDRRANDFYADENTYAAYIMPQFDFGLLRVVGGVRMEHYNSTIDGWNVSYDSDGNVSNVSKIRTEQEYTNFFPSIHLNYALSSMTFARASYARGITRPRFDDASPTVQEDEDNERLTVGNPNLNPEYADRFYLKLERYFSDQVGLFSIGLFYMDIHDMIAERRVDIDDPADFPGWEQYEGWELREPVNLENAWNAGVEVSWHQQLNFLPGRLRNLGIFTNYTYTYSEIEFEDPIRRKVMGEDMIPHLVNFALNYEQGIFFGQLSANYQSATISSHDDDDFTFNGIDVHFDRYDRAILRLDATLHFRIANNARLSFEMHNITGRPYQDRYLSPYTGTEAGSIPRMYTSIQDRGRTGALSLQISL